MLLSAAVLLIAPFTPSIFTADRCLTSRYYGSYGSGAFAVFLTDETCVSSLGSDVLFNATAVPLSSQHDRLIWVEEASVEPTLKTDVDPGLFLQDLANFIDRLDASPARPCGLDLQPDEKHHFVASTHSKSRSRAVWSASSSAVITLSSDTIPILDTLLPRFWRAIPLPLLPLPIDPIPPKSVDRIKRVLAHLAFDPDVAAIVNNISVPQMRNDIRFLTGEDGKSGIVSRHSFSEGSRIAAAWLKERFEETGATCHLQEFILGFAPNVIW